MEEEAVKCPSCPPAWLATFADLMSLLMCFFVLLLSFSEMDALKFKQLAGSMSQAFGVQRDVKTKEIPKGTSIIAKEFTPGRPTPTVLKVMRQHTTDEYKKNLDFRKGPENSDKSGEKSKAEKRLEKLKKALKDQIAAGSIEVSGDNQRTIIRIREKGSFSSGNATLSSRFKPVLKKIADALEKTPGKIHISGHTDNIPISTFRFRSNWELSSARAVSILEHILQINKKIPNERIVIQGYADTIPLVPNSTPKNRATNRRVEIEVIKQTETVKDMPSLIKFSE
ncbi:MAG: type VI secretion system protein TssL [endosymbiont of Galathealinum brachiosum]|uniref:Type VI secretion system protein TssL n=1 Tax=endosymbiont of Galathealinum brachiosum TaxID=2200906 RepID=A0A370DJU6_9GAMM|nr:MAG: type VI secretion system protein TssL [endosymbiont of Galathealinum brachiosum]